MGSKVAIIGGSGIYKLKAFKEVKEEYVKTPYGEVLIFRGRWNKKEIIFLPRHGKNHRIPPHKINYRGNIFALKSQGVKRILATSASGSLNQQMKPGDLVIINQFIDFTKNRPSTFFEENDVYHVDMTEPYCSELSNIFTLAADKMGLKFHSKGTYLCAEGPRFETKAEIKAYGLLGADIIGMTNVPEVVLAREAEICYSSVAVVTNMAAGIKEGCLTSTEVSKKMREMSRNVTKLFLTVVNEIPEKRSCCCGNALRDSKMKSL